MTTARQPNESAVRTINSQEARVLFEAEVQRYLDISAADFVRRYDAGEWSEPCVNPDIAWLIMVRRFKNGGGASQMLHRTETRP